MKKVSQETYEAVMDLYGWRCRICSAPADEIHHRLAKHKWRIKKFPLFIHSPMNLMTVCKACHNSGRIYDYEITDREAEVYEEYLTRIKK